MSEILDIASAASVWVLPLLLAVTLHEAAHGLVAQWCGDDTAARMGRVTLNPLRHIDPFGTVILPGLLLLSPAPFVFGYAKPVPVHFAMLDNPRRDMALVAAAGPAANFLQAIAAGLLFHALILYAGWAGEVGPVLAWIGQNLSNLLIINVVLAIFNLLPVPPLDGGRILMAALPNHLAERLGRIDQVGVVVLLGVIFLIPLTADLLGLHVDIIGSVLWPPVSAAIGGIKWLTGLPT